jgi:hypothetical protein
VAASAVTVAQRLATVHRQSAQRQAAERGQAVAAR